MDVGVLEILFCRFFVVLCAEPGKSLFVEVADVGVDGGDHNVESEVKLLLFEKQRVVYVRLHYPFGRTNFRNI